MIPLSRLDQGIPSRRSKSEAKEKERGRRQREEPRRESRGWDGERGWQEEEGRGEGRGRERTAVIRRRTESSTRSVWNKNIYIISFPCVSPLFQPNILPFQPFCSLSFFSALLPSALCPHWLPPSKRISRDTVEIQNADNCELLSNQHFLNSLLGLGRQQEGETSSEEEGDEVRGGGGQQQSTTNRSEIACLLTHHWGERGFIRNHFK